MEWIGDGWGMGDGGGGYQIAGGTGITPMLQVVEYILDNPEDTTQVKDRWSRC